MFVGFTAHSYLGLWSQERTNVGKRVELTVSYATLLYQYVSVSMHEDGSVMKLFAVKKLDGSVLNHSASLLDMSNAHVAEWENGKF